MMSVVDAREKLLRLEHENRRLREQQNGQQQSGPSNEEVLETVLGGLQERIDQLEAENRCSFHDNPAKSSHPLVHSCQSSLLSSKPFFAGDVSLKSRTLHASASCSQLTPTPHTPHTPIERRVSRVQQLKEAFLARVTDSQLTSFNRFQRSNSFGYDVALGFGSSSRPVLDVVDHPRSTTSSPSTPHRPLFVLPDELEKVDRVVEADPADKVEPADRVEIEETPPPPVEAVVITRDSTPRSQTAEDNVDGSSWPKSPSSVRTIQAVDSFDSPVSFNVEFDSVSTDCDDHFLLDSLSNTSNSRNYASNIKASMTPNDVIEVDSAFRADRGSVESESVSVSSFSIISEAVTASDRSFERCDSSTFFLTPRTATHNSQDTVSRKSFTKTLKKRKMFKVAANAMFSLCGP